MLMMRVRTGIGIAAAALAVAALSACGGGGGSSTTTAAAATTQSPAAAKAEITKNWKAFFSSKTPAAQKADLLQNGKQFEASIKKMSKSPLASDTKAVVKRVTLQGPSKAKVVYTIDVAGQPALKNQSGVAVRTGGTWKVGDASFCSLLSLQGAAPAACPKS